jgi:MFS family permease
LVYALSAVPAGIAADRFGRRLVILIGFILFALVYAGFARATTPMAIWALFALYGVFMGLTEGIQKAFLATIIPPEFKATAFGVYAMAVGIAMFPASLAGGWLWEHYSPAATFYFGSVMALVAAILFTIFVLPGTGPHHSEL